MDRALERLESANASSKGQEVRLTVQQGDAFVMCIAVPQHHDTLPCTAGALPVQPTPTQRDRWPCMWPSMMPGNLQLHGRLYAAGADGAGHL